MDNMNNNNGNNSMNNSSHGEGGDNNNNNNNSPPPSGGFNRGSMGGGMGNFNDPTSNFGPSSQGGMNPMMMSQFSMMGSMPNNAQMMNMMGGGFCGPTGGGGGSMGGYGGGFPGDSQGMMNPQAMAQMMSRQSNNKRGMDFDDADIQPPSSKRGNFGRDAMEPLDGGSNHGSDSNKPGPSNNNDQDDTANDDDEKPSSEGGDAPPSDTKEHAVIPPSKEGIKFYSRNDVLCGRGGGTNVHPGNRRFRDLINANRRAYLKARKNDKPAISRSIVRTIREMNGRFLKKDEKQGLWFEIGDDGAREKTSQALRQRAPEMRKILFEDEQRQTLAQQQEMMMQRSQMMGMGGGHHHQGGMGGMGMHQGHMGGHMGGMGMHHQGHMGGMGGPSSQMGRESMGGGGRPSDQGGNQELLAKYNMLHQKNWLAQEKNMVLQRLAMSGMNPSQLNQTQDNIDTMRRETLIQQGMKPVTPRGA